MVAQKKCYQENNNHNFILRPSPPPLSLPEKNRCLLLFHFGTEQWGEAINRTLKIFPVLRQLAAQGPMTSYIELTLICMGASFSFGGQCCMSSSGHCRVEQGSQGTIGLARPQVCLDAIYSLTLWPE